MNTLVLTQTGGILRPFAIFLGWIMDGIYRFLEMFGIMNVGLTIILLTVVVNIILIPLTYRQQKFTRMSAIMNPELQKIQQKYKNKKDEKSMRLMQAETSAVYDKYGASPAGGCLPTLIQIPILFALYRVIYNVPAYVGHVKQVYENIAQPIMSADKDGSIMSSLIDSLGLKVSNFDITNINKVIDALYLVKSTAWSAVSDAFSASAQVVDAIAKYSSQIISMNSLPGGLSISDNPIVFSGGLAGWFPGVLIPILAGLSQWINIKVNQRYQAQNSGGSGSDTANQMAASMKTMNNVMPVMSIFFCATLPVGIGLYWISSAAIRTVITLIMDKFLSKTDIDSIIEANKEKAEKKAEKRGLKQEKLDQYASMNTRSISSIATSNVNHDENTSAGSKNRSSSKNRKNNNSSKRAEKSSAAKDGDASAGAVKTDPESSGSSARSESNTEDTSGSSSGRRGKKKRKNGSSSDVSSQGSISDIANMLKNSDRRK